MRKLLLLVMLLFGALQLGVSQKVQKYIDDFVSDAALQHTNIGIHAVNVRTGEVLGAYEAQESMATASVLKLLTTATALEQKGANFRYATPISYTGEIVEGKLQGDLVIEGVGDPTFLSKYFPGDDALLQIARLLKNRGISRIEGNLVLDVSRFQSVVPPTWTWEDIGNYYGATVHAINFKDNFYELTFRTGVVGTKAEVLSTFPTQSLKIKSEVLSSKINADRAYIFGAPFSQERVLRGTLPENRKRFRVKGSMPNPPETFGNTLHLALRESGIVVEGSVKVSKQKVKTVACLGTIMSPTLKAIVTEINRKSINLFAEALLLLSEGAAEQTAESHLNALKAFWKQKGLDVAGLCLHDGSGLSHFNAVPPKFFTDLLCYMKQSEKAAVFEKTLAVSGRIGTLEYLGKGTALTGRVKGKSGTMQQVCCYVGYLTTQSGEEVAFAVMLNNFSIPTYKVRQKIAKMLMKW